MARHTPESLLISAVINSLDVNHHKQWGIHSQHFFGYRDEFEWLEGFIKSFKRTPSREEFTTQWPDFPMSTEQEDGRWPASEVSEQYNSRTMLRTLTKAGTHIKQGDVGTAISLVKGIDLHTIVEPPSNALVDHAFLDDYDTQEDRITLPWRTPQRATDGIGAGELWYIAARPGQGKSAHTSVIAAQAAMEGRSSVIYSMEMTKRAVQVRLQAILANMLGIEVSARDMKARRFDRLAYKKLMDEISERVPGTIHVHTPAEGPCRPSTVAAQAKDFDLTIVDHVGLMRPDGGGKMTDDWRTVAAVSNELKEISLAQNTRILAASQVNREGESLLRPPKASKLANSDALTQDADVIITLMRHGKAPATHFSLEKNRDGENQVQWFTAFDANIGDYREIDRDDADELRDSYGDE